MQKRKALLRQDRLILIFLVSILFFACSKESGLQPLKEGSKVPAFTLRAIDGTSLWSIEDEKGSVVIINFWATWCPPCREEIPSLQKFYRQIRNDRKIRLITVLYRDNPFAALEFMKEMHYDFPVKTDPDLKAAQLFGVTGVPETYIIDSDGTLLQRIIGPFDWDSPDFKEYISRVVNK